MLSRFLQPRLGLGTDGEPPFLDFYGRHPTMKPVIEGGRNPCPDVMFLFVGNPGRAEVFL